MNDWNFPDTDERVILTGNLTPFALEEIIRILRSKGRVAIQAAEPLQISALEFAANLLTNR